MLTIESRTETRKELVNRLGELLETKPQYGGAPAMEYHIGAFTVDREGNLLVPDEEAGNPVLTTLAGEGMIDDEVNELNTEEAQAEEGTEEPGTDELTKVNISVPMEHHTGSSLRNLVNLIYQRQELLNKATGGNFRADLSLTEDLLEDGKSGTVQEFLQTISEEADKLDGIEFSADKVTFTGFPETDDPDTIQAYTILASLMNKQALTQKRILTKEVDDSNEKFAFRIWLIRLGMKGDEFKTARKILLSKLSGNSAFRTEEAKQRALDKAKRQREAAKAPEAAEEPASEEPAEETPAEETTEGGSSDEVSE